MNERRFFKHPSVSALFFFVLMLGLSGGEPRASDDASSRRTLAGVKGVHVKVETVNPEVEADGLKAPAVQSDAEGLLKGVGIRVLSKAEAIDEPGEPTLNINLHVLKLRATSEYIYSIHVAFRQNAFLSRTPVEVLGAATWSPGLVTGITSDLGKIRNSVKEVVQNFVEAYGAANR